MQKHSMLHVCVSGQMGSGLRIAPLTSHCCHLRSGTGEHISRLVAMEPPSCKPMATWKTWWDPSLPRSIAKALQESTDFTKIPGGGKLLETDSFRSEDLKNPHVALVVEGLLRSYPSDKQPSGYLLADAVMYLDLAMNHSLLGPPQSNPIKERSRRDRGLVEGGKLRKLLSFVRTSSLKHTVGKTPESTYMKQLANARVVSGKSRSSVSSCASDTSPSSPVEPSPVPLGIKLPFENMFIWEMLKVCFLAKFITREWNLCPPIFGSPGKGPQPCQNQLRFLSTSMSLIRRWCSWGVPAESNYLDGMV